MLDIENQPPWGAPIPIFPLGLLPYSPAKQRNGCYIRLFLVLDGWLYKAFGLHLPVKCMLAVGSLGANPPFDRTCFQSQNLAVTFSNTVEPRIKRSPPLKRSTLFGPGKTEVVLSSPYLAVNLEP